MTTTTQQVAVNDIGTEEDFLAAVDATIKYFNLSLIHISEPTRHFKRSRMPSSA